MSTLFSNQGSVFSLLVVCAEKGNDQAFEGFLLRRTTYSQLFVAQDAAVRRGKIQLLRLHRSLGRSEAQRLKEPVCALVFRPFLHLLKTNETSSCSS